nr:PREDICTED: uncharacterized protein LOC100882838 [Megachile rotundata]XP_012138914.1 PREDICTED: uncharacterized protein LOC100882838 [Megachile rotundata]
MRYLNYILRIVLQCVIFISHIQSEISNTVISVKTDFSCINKTAGFYADTGASCKIYHTCDEYGNKFTYHCPEETAFRQDALICDHAHLVRCNEYTYNSKYTEDKSRNSSVNKNQFVFRVTQSPKTNKMRYGFSFSTKESSNNFNRTKVAYNTRNFTAPQRASLVNNSQNGGSFKNNFAVKQTFNSWDKLNEKDRNNQNYLNRKTNDATYNFMKLQPPSVNARNQDGGKNDQTIKNATNFSFTNHRNYPYLETLKSIQKNAPISIITTTTRPATTSKSVTTTELPVYALTLSLKPLVPSELEDDPYYPKLPTSTESYYTPHHKEWSSIKEAAQTTWPSVHFELPSILPDLNSLEDIVDRRKLFYIPRIRSN